VDDIATVWLLGNNSVVARKHTVWLVGNKMHTTSVVGRKQDAHNNAHNNKMHTTMHTTTRCTQQQDAHNNKMHTRTLASCNKAPTIEIASCFSEYLQKKCCGRESRLYHTMSLEKVVCTTQCLCQSIPQSVCVKRPSKRDDLPTDDLQFFLSCSKIQGVQPCLPAPLPHILILACHKFKRPRDLVSK